MYKIMYKDYKKEMYKNYDELDDFEDPAFEDEFKESEVDF